MTVGPVPAAAATRAAAAVRLATRHAGVIGPQGPAPTSSTLSVGAFTLCRHSTAYGRHVSGAMENRAAVFTSKPQAVEVYQAGGWWPGELLGWRHAADGSCQVWVRVVLGGAEETAWTDLETLRLPERHLAMAPEPASAARAEREQSVARHPSSRREHRADVGASATTSMATTTMTMVRDLSVVSGATVASSAGRRRAPEVPTTTSTGGRRRAPEEPAVASSGGRRRAPETSPEMAAVSVPGGRRRAPEDAVVAPSGGRRRAPEDSTSTVASPAPLLGRHGVPAPAASADPGRHRTADTGLFAAISDETSTISETRRPAAPAAAARGRALPSTLPAKPEGAGGTSGDNWTAPSGLESDLLTRPMRLSDHVPHARRPRVDGSRRGV
jgi:hypothetical protein